MAHLGRYIADIPEIIEIMMFTLTAPLTNSRQTFSGDNGKSKNHGNKIRQLSARVGREKRLNSHC